MMDALASRARLLPELAPSTYTFAKNQTDQWRNAPPPACFITPQSKPPLETKSRIGTTFQSVKREALYHVSLKVVDATNPTLGLQFDALDLADRLEAVILGYQPSGASSAFYLVSYDGLTFVVDEDPKDKARYWAFYSIDFDVAVEFQESFNGEDNLNE